MAQKQVCNTEVPRIVLGVAAHPDDLDFLAGGTVAAWSAQGAEIYFLVLTNGNKGSADLSADPEALTILRRQEQREAAAILGVKDVFFCNYDDGTLVVDMNVKKDIVRVIRQVRPDTVITLDPCMVYDVDMGYINHPDHRAAGQAALDAVFPLARDHLSFPELLKDEGLSPHNVATVLLTHFGKQNCYIDVSDTFETKLQALAAHASQYPDFPAIQTMMRTMATKLGTEADVRYAEGFVRLEVR